MSEMIKRIREEIQNEEDIPVIPSDWAEIKSYQRKVILNDGTELNGYAARASMSDDLWVYPEDSSLSYMDLVMIFTNPEKTACIKSKNSDDQILEFNGYTRLSIINSNLSGKFSVCMGKPIT